jgi:hypothetical protein
MMGVQIMLQENPVAMQDAAVVLVAGCGRRFAIHRFALPTVLATFARPYRAERQFTQQKIQRQCKKPPFVRVAGCEPPRRIPQVCAAGGSRNVRGLLSCDIS